LAKAFAAAVMGQMGIAGRLPPENDVNFSGFFAVTALRFGFQAYSSRDVFGQHLSL
jgi:hypothetical protein